MKIPKETNRFCPYCNKKTDQKIKVIGTGFSRGAMRRFGGKARAKLRGIGVGIGNYGKWSKPAITKNKRKSKTTKKTNFMYTCKVCKKSKYQNKGIRAGKVIQE